ncbi:MAG: hypothetical protein LBG90_03460 [Spirochaetaceae bacterium]|nr:hypothetical protein [Spirochaetaceae bacterium]
MGSCNKDDDDSPGRTLDGTWEYSGTTYAMRMICSGSNWQMKFKADDAEYEDSKKGTYTLDGNAITFTTTHVFEDDAWEPADETETAAATLSDDGNSFQMPQGDLGTLTFVKQ